MSLINQMLQDLDKRRAGEAAVDHPDGAVANEIRAVAPQNRSYPVWQIVALLLFLLAGMLAWLLLRQNSVPTEPVVSPVAVQPPVQDVSGPTLKTEARLETLPAGTPTRTVAKERSVAGMGSVLSKAQDTPQAAVPVSAENAVSQDMPGQPVNPNINGHVAVEKQVKELSPQQRAENEYRKAIGLTQQGRLAEAMDSLRHASKLDPFHLSARQMLVALLVEGKRAIEAEQILHEGLKLSPEQSGFAMLLARLQAGRGESNDALETLRKGLPYASDKADYRALYAALLQRQERHAEAIEQYQAALRTAPNSGVWLMGLGISLQAEKRNKEAEDAFIRAKASNTLSSELKAFVEQRVKQLQ